jgi:hypothetical protein
MDAVRTIAGGQPAAAYVRHGWSSEKLKEINKTKRAARPSPDTSNTCAVEYLYGYWRGSEDGPGHPVRFRIIKKTAKRIFYARYEEVLDAQGEPVKGIVDNDDGVGIVDRQKLEAEGIATNRSAGWWSPEYHLHASFEGMMHSLFSDREAIPDLHRLKAEMAAAHPDRGGNSTEFIAARARYVAARRQVRVMRSTHSPTGDA